MAARGLGLLMVGAMLVACGGGGGGESPVSLKSKADVIREVRNITALHDLSGGAVASKSTATGRRSSMMERLQVRQGRAGIPAQPRPMATEVVQCDSGTTTYDSAAAQARNLPLFGVTPTMDVVSTTSSNCRYDYEGSRLTSSGHEEYADNEAYAGEGPLYVDVVHGSGGNAYVMTYEDLQSGDNSAWRQRGRSEERHSSQAFELRTVLDSTFTLKFGGDRLNFEYRYGNAGAPFSIAASKLDDSISLNGPFFYSFTGCGGGFLDYATQSPLLLGSDDYGEFLRGGVLELVAGSASVLVTFQDDGGLQYDFGSGTQSISREELLSGSGGCDSGF